ncbi:MAG: hypothetical protein ACE5EU_15485, partial [Paracoccaceae bacterium]
KACYVFATARSSRTTKSRRPSPLLVQDALGLEEERLPEPLGADNNELVVAVHVQEGVDLRRSMQQSIVEIFDDTDIVSVYSPRSHTLSQGEPEATA